MKKIGIIGAGSWGTALAISLEKYGNEIKIWDVDKDLLNTMKTKRENRKYLPNIHLEEGIQIMDSPEETLKDADFAIFAVPAQHFREAFTNVKDLIDDKTIVVNVAKGIEIGTQLRLSEIAYSIKPDVKYVALSGPSHAEEVGRHMPTMVTVASKDPKLAREVQKSFGSSTLRLYTSDDLVSVEIGGALKNVIALGAGIADGLGFGDNIRAALITRGITEMSRFGMKLGGKPETFAGLAGVGDLIVTCTSMHSRNYRCGLMMGKGISASEAAREIGMVVEGIYTVEAAHAMAKKLNVEMPITDAIYKMICEKITAEEALDQLMSREMKPEINLDI